MRQYLPYVLYALIVVALVAGIIFAFNARDPEPRGKNTPGTSQQDKDKKSDTANKPQSGGDRSAGSVADRPQPTYTAPNSSQPSNRGGSAPSTPAPSGTPAPSASPPANGQQLAKSGPEHVALLFAAATFGGAALFSAYQRRGLNA